MSAPGHLDACLREQSIVQREGLALDFLIPNLDYKTRHSVPLSIFILMLIFKSAEYRQYY